VTVTPVMNYLDATPAGRNDQLELPLSDGLMRAFEPNHRSSESDAERASATT
jgi:predicted dithiol-disulfide oxidoreductase (DUF899 family)